METSDKSDDRAVALEHLNVLHGRRSVAALPRRITGTTKTPKATKKEKPAIG